MKRFYIVGYPHYFRTLAEACAYVVETFFEFGIADSFEIVSVRTGRRYCISLTGHSDVSLRTVSN